jgi:hypothetical protein
MRRYESLNVKIPPGRFSKYYFSLETSDEGTCHMCLLVYLLSTLFTHKLFMYTYT